MTFLLDSHAFVWYEVGDPRCSERVRTAIDQDGLETYFSAVTAWEIAVKAKAGRWPDAVPLLDRLDRILDDHRFRRLPITIEHARLAGQLEGDHRDPFDRMLAAQAIVENLTLVTTDRAFRMFAAKTFW